MLQTVDGMERMESDTMNRLALTAAAALAAGALGPGAYGQDLAPVQPIAAGHTLLTVAAQGSSTRTPDMAVFNAGVTTQGTTASDALAQNSTQMNAVFAALKRAGIADKDIQTSDLSISPVYSQPTRNPDGSYDENTRRIVAYQVNNSVLVRQRKLDSYGKVIDALVSAGANQVNGPSFTLSRPEAAQDEARNAAIKAARERAQLYAGAAGLRVGRIVTISETEGYAAPRAKYGFAEAVAAAPPPPVATGQVEVTAQVTVQFELEP